MCNERHVKLVESLPDNVAKIVVDNDGFIRSINILEKIGDLVWKLEKRVSNLESKKGG